MGEVKNCRSYFIFGVIIISIIIVLTLGFAHFIKTKGYDSERDCVPLECVAIDDALSSFSNFESLLEEVKLFPSREKVCDALRTIFSNLKRKKGLVNPQALLLAHEIKKEMQNEPLQSLTDSYTTMKLEFPTNIRAIIWNSNLYLKNVRYNECLITAETYIWRDNLRRNVSTVSDESLNRDKRSTWQFESDDGKTFLIENMKYYEYLYSPGNDFLYSKERRHVYTWVPGDTDEMSTWKIDLVNNENIIIRNVLRDDQPLYASGTYSSEKERNVFTWMPKDQYNNAPDDDGYWKVITA